MVHFKLKIEIRKVGFLKVVIWILAFFIFP
jgi:hypothetical protein